MDLFIARSALESGHGLSHGVHHLACLLEVDPSRPDWRDLADRYILACGTDLDTIIPESEQRFASTEALRAYFRHAQGRTTDAVKLLVDVATAMGEPRYLHAWALDWLEPIGAVEQLPEETGSLLFATVLSLTGEAKCASASNLKAVGRWAALMERVSSHYTMTPLLTMIRAGLQRKSGAFDRALAIAGSIDCATSFNQAAAIGLAYRLKREFDASERAFIKGLQLEPDNISGKLEAGDTCFEAANWQKALVWYEDALKQQPDLNWAVASAAYCRFKLHEDGAVLQHLAALAKQGNQRAHQLWFAEKGALDESGDASANVLRQMRDKWLSKTPSQANGKIRLGLSTLEAPSNRLAMKLEMAAFGIEDDIEINVASVPVRDPRIPIAEVEHAIWKYEGTNPIPALPAPSLPVTEAIAALAEEPYDPWLNWTKASHLASLLGPGKALDILAVMVFPPPLPVGRSALEWLPRVQLTAAQVLGQINTGWEMSVRRKMLLSVLYGPWDWSTVAAIRVLAWIARDERAYALDIHHAFENLEKHLPTEGHWDWVEVLYDEWQTIPYLFDSEREELKRKREGYLAD